MPCPRSLLRRFTYLTVLMTCLVVLAVHTPKLWQVQVAARDTHKTIDRHTPQVANSLPSLARPSLPNKPEAKPKYIRYKGRKHNYTLIEVMTKRVFLEANETILELKGKLELDHDALVKNKDKDFKEWFNGLLKKDVPQLEEEFYHMVTDNQTTCQKVVRLGPTNDAGYWFCEDGNYAMKPGKSCLVFSYGVGCIWDFMDDIEKKYQCTVHGFDPTMAIADHRRSEHIWFHNTALYGKEYNIGDAEFRTMKTIHQNLNPRKAVIDILKLDIEGSEFSALRVAIDDGSLIDVKQLMFEYHSGHIHNFYKKQEDTREVYIYMIMIMKEVQQLGFQLYRSDVNPIRKFKSPYTGKTRPRFGNLYFLNKHFR